VMHAAMVKNFDSLSGLGMSAKATTPLLRFVVDLLPNEPGY